MFEDAPNARRRPGSNTALVAGVLAGLAYFVWRQQAEPFAPRATIAVAVVVWFVVRMTFVIADAIKKRPR
jgi:hypothetical protein